MRRLFVFVLATLLFCSAMAFGCNVCTTCATKCRGYYGCYPFCQPECDDCGLRVKPYAEQLEPELRLAQRNGYLTVTAILPEAADSNSDIQVGDRLLSVNGKAKGFGTACNDDWEYEHSGTSRVTLQRGGTVFDVVVALRPVKSLLASHWRTAALLKKVKSVEGQAQPSGMPYLFGVQLQESVDGRALVTNILAGSPADESGIRVGDEIASVNGIVPSHSEERMEHLATGTDYREVVEIGLLRDGVRRIVRLQARGISEILVHSETLKHSLPMTVPMAKLSVEQR